MNPRDRLRGVPSADLAVFSASELHTLREGLRAERDTAYESLSRIADAAAGRQMTRAQAADFAAAEATCTECNAMVSSVEDALARQDIDRGQLVAVGTGVGDDGLAAHRGAMFGARTPYVDGAPLARDQSFAGFTRAHGDVREGHDDLSLRRFLRGAVTGDWSGANGERRAMAEGVLAAGGFMVPEILAAEVIDLARSQTRVLEAGARLVPMAAKTVQMARWLQDPTPAWHSENGIIAPSDAVIGRVTLDAKALASLTVVSRELLEDAEGIENELRAAMAAQFALTIDRAALYGSGTDPEPRGVVNTTGVTALSMGANGAAPTDYDWQIDAVGELADRNETPTATIMSPRTARTLGKLTASDGQPLQVPGYVAAVPRLVTGQVPNDQTVGTATDASEAITADWSQLLVGVRTGLQISVLTERYADTGQVGLLCWWRGDVAVARAGAFVRTTGLLA